MRMEMIRPVKLDQLDRRILSLLQQNARISLSSLSQYLSRPKPTIMYHLNQLENAKVIRNYQTHFALFRPHVQYAFIFFQFTQANNEEIRIELAKSPYCITLFSAGGTFNTIMGVAFPSSMSKTEVLAAIDKKNQSVRTEWFDVDDFSLFPLNYAASPLNIHEPARKKGNTFQSFFEMTKGKKETTLSADDVKIMRALSRNARSSLKELVDQTQIGKAKLKARIGELIRGGTISKFSASINPYAFEGIIMAFLMVNSNNADHEKLKRCIARHQSGNGFATFKEAYWNAGAILNFKTKAQLIEFENDLRNMCPSMKDYQLNFIHQQYKLDWFPPIVDSTLQGVFSK